MSRPDVTSSSVDGRSVEAMVFHQLAREVVADLNAAPATNAVCSLLHLLSVPSRDGAALSPASVTNLAHASHQVLPLARTRIQSTIF